MCFVLRKWPKKQTSVLARTTDPYPCLALHLSEVKLVRSLGIKRQPASHTSSVCGTPSQTLFSTLKEINNEGRAQSPAASDVALSECGPVALWEIQEISNQGVEMCVRATKLLLMMKQRCVTFSMFIELII